ncbi:MAG: hypothetical protein EOO81_06505 [Oxalobacteraceae bacterium]|nr:MAG: hypothetical protein EOO81_06505 [Oxalobacteraceae bacterium]
MYGDASVAHHNQRLAAGGNLFNQLADRVKLQSNCCPLWFATITPSTPMTAANQAFSAVRIFVG